MKSICEGLALGMATDFEFKDNTIKVLNAMNGKMEAVLEECAGELKSQAARNTRRKTGDTASKWAHHVSKEGQNKHVAVVGNPLENAIWEEFGTGDYALNGDGRKGGWGYEDEKTGETIWTHGKTPSRAFWKAYTKLKSKIIKHIQNSLKGL